MTRQELKSFRQRVSTYIDKRRLRDALHEIKETAHKRMAWEIEDKLTQTEENYAYMLRYLTQGVSDPDLKDVYDNLVSDTYGLLDSLVSSIDSIDNPSLYYSNIRYYQSHPNIGRLPALLRAYESKADKMSLFEMVLSNENEDKNKANRETLEKLQNEIFVRIWSLTHLSGEDADTIKGIIDSKTIRSEMKQHIISAITLGLLNQYDKRRLQLLMNAYLTAQDIKVSSAALVGMLLGLWKYRNRPLTRQLKNTLDAVKDKDTWASDLRIAYIELIRARDTERINRKMRDEVIPRMEKLRPDIMDKINQSKIDPEDPASLQENPEWQEMLEKSGIADQLKELTEIQMEGGDVMMSTFAHLKNFPFFQNIANWFLPFDPAHTSISKTADQLDVMGDMLEQSHIMCDSDKYSFMMAISNMPESQRGMMTSQFKQQSSAIYEAMSNLNAGQQQEERRLAVNSYMQNIYRFFKLFYRKEEFYDPFGSSINLTAVPTLADDFNDTELLNVVAEFYFKLQYMEDALHVYQHLEDISAGDASRYQKIGFCYEKIGEYAKAADYYERASLIANDSAWTVKRLATVYRALGDKATALKYYSQLASMQPDSVNAAMLYGQSLLENGEYREALHEFYRVEFMDETSTRAYRPLAWTLFLTGDLEGAKNYYLKLINNTPQSTDYLNLGHVYLALGNIHDAVDSYLKAIKSEGGNREWLLQSLDDDMPALKQAGIDPLLIPMIADATAY